MTPTNPHPGARTSMTPDKTSVARHALNSTVDGRPR